MNSNFQDKNCWYQTNLTYEPAYKLPQALTDRSIPPLDKQNVVPCGAQLQTFISTLNQKKYQLKSLMIQKQKLDQMTLDQEAKLQSQNIRQNFEVQKQMQLLRMNKRVLEQAENIKKQKLKNMQKMLSLKKCLQSRFQQIMEMKNLLSSLKQQNETLQQNIQETNMQKMNVQNQTNELDLMWQNLQNEAHHMKQTVRQSEVHKTTVQTALNMFRSKINSTLNEIKNQNKQTRRLGLQLTETNDKVKKRRQQKAQNEINSSQLMIRNRQIQEINIKLRNDLDKCRLHLQCVLKNNDLLQNSIEEFTYVDERVTKIMNRNQLKKL